MALCFLIFPSNFWSSATSSNPLKFPVSSSLKTGVTTSPDLNLPYPVTANPLFYFFCLSRRAWALCYSALVLTSSFLWEKSLLISSMLTVFPWIHGSFKISATDGLLAGSGANNLVNKWINSFEKNPWGLFFWWASQNLDSFPVQRHL